jgi:exonuclease SbcD
MKILHTSDWHIGKQLKKIDLLPDINLFFNWLIDTIINNKIDVLLVSGDIFDQANPSQESLATYYSFLKKCIEKCNFCKIIITSGNHDSPALLEAPKPLLELLNISIISSKPKHVENLFIEVEANGEKLVVAAIPFLRERDLRISDENQTYFDKVEATKKGLENFFNEVNNYYIDHYSGIPFIIMAHLFVAGSEISESERQIQVGNLAGINAQIFGNNANYVALGHIHKPQKVGNLLVRYCGSPIPLSFSELNDNKKVEILHLNNKELKIESLFIPVFRRLVKLEGNLNEVKNKLNQYSECSDFIHLAEINIIEENYNSLIVNEAYNFTNQEFNNAIRVVESKIKFKENLNKQFEEADFSENISAYSPMEMFEKKLLEDQAFVVDSGLMQKLMNEFASFMENIDLNEMEQ